jgi:hypothetical protein
MVSREAIKKINKREPGRKNNELPKKKSKGKKRPKRKKKSTSQINLPLGDSFIPSMKSQNEIFWMVHWWVLGHSSRNWPFLPFNCVTLWITLLYVVFPFSYSPCCHVGYVMGLLGINLVTLSPKLSNRLVI